MWGLTWRIRFFPEWWGDLPGLAGGWWAYCRCAVVSISMFVICFAVFVLLFVSFCVCVVLCLNFLFSMVFVLFSLYKNTHTKTN
jgi:hypothetical protein